MQRKLLIYITDYFGKHGISPSYDEMTAHMGMSSKSGPAQLIGHLEREGYLARRPQQARNLVLLKRLPSMDPYSQTNLAALPREQFKALVDNLNTIIGERRKARAA